MKSINLPNQQENKEGIEWLTDRNKYYSLPCFTLGDLKSQKCLGILNIFMLWISHLEKWKVFFKLFIMKKYLSEVTVYSSAFGVLLPHLFQCIFSNASGQFFSYLVYCRLKVFDVYHIHTLRRDRVLCTIWQMLE